MLSTILGLCAGAAYGALVVMWFAKRAEIRTLQSESQRAHDAGMESDRKNEERLSECKREWEARSAAMAEDFKYRLATVSAERFAAGVSYGKASYQLIMRHHKDGENKIWRKSAGEIKLIALLFEGQPKQVYLDTEHWKSTEIPAEIKQILDTALSAGATFIGSMVPALL